MLLAALSLLMVEPAPLEMPRATAYCVSSHGRYRLEDRYNRTDLWVSQSVDGRWIDADGRQFTLSHLATMPPAGPSADSSATRTDFAAGEVPIDRRDLKGVRAAVAALSPVEIGVKGRPPRQMPRGFKDVDYYQGTNTSAIVCAFLPEKADVWRLAVWQLAEGDDFDECVEIFEKEVFGTPPAAPSPRLPPSASERERLRADAKHSVAAYGAWHATDAPEFTVLDDLPAVSRFVVALTNDLPAMRARYASVVPTAVDATNTLCVARIFASRDEYDDALEMDGLSGMRWSAAYWSVRRRELVAYLPPSGEAELLRTVRHEAFHQYLSYASSMIPVSPWLNEGYAQYFEDGARPDSENGPGREAWGLGAIAPTPEELERYSALLPALLMMDYGEFYDGTDELRRLKYRLAWSIAVFIEVGAPKVRFNPFADLKARYFEKLLATQDMRKAVEHAFGGEDMKRLFVAEWLRFWKNR